MRTLALMGWFSSHGNQLLLTRCWRKLTIVGGRNKGCGDVGTRREEMVRGKEDKGGGKKGREEERGRVLASEYLC